MANIVIIGTDAQHKANTSLRDILQAPPQSHTCTLIAESSTQSLLSFDLIIMTRHGLNDTGNANVLAAFNNGIPLIVGMTQGSHVGLGVAAKQIGGRIGLISKTTEQSPASTSIVFKSNGFSSDYKLGDVVNVHQGSEFYSFTDYTSIASGAVVYGTSVAYPSERVLLAIAPKGSASLLNTTFPAACAYAGFLYANNSTYSTQATLFITTLVNKVLDLNLTAVISGYSLNENQEPVPSDVYVYKHEDGTLFKKTTTESDGSYAVTVGKGEYFVVCKNHDRDSNLQVLGYIKGVE